MVDLREIAYFAGFCGIALFRKIAPVKKIDRRARETLAAFLRFLRGSVAFPRDLKGRASLLGRPVVLFDKVAGGRRAW